MMTKDGGGGLVPARWACCGGGAVGGGALHGAWVGWDGLGHSEMHLQVQAFSHQHTAGGGG